MGTVRNAESWVLSDLLNLDLNSHLTPEDLSAQCSYQSLDLKNDGKEGQWEFLEGASWQVRELGFRGSTASCGTRLRSPGSWARRAPANHPTHSVICPPHNQSSQALSAAGQLNYRLRADGGDGSVCAIRGEKGVKGKEGPFHCPPSPDSRHPPFWRVRLLAPAIRRPLSPRTHSLCGANR